jgi:hypothetical protein
MDRSSLNKDSGQVTVDEIIAELNRQISSLNFELTVNKLAVQKLQKIILTYEETDDVKSKNIAQDF